jgi:hypothetical protein
MKYTIALLAGGIGPVINETVKVSDAIAKFNHEIIWTQL